MKTCDKAMLMPVSFTVEVARLFLDPFCLRKVNKTQEQAGAELCQAQVKLWLAKVEIFFPLIEIKVIFI